MNYIFTIVISRVFSPSRFPANQVIAQRIADGDQFIPGGCQVLTNTATAGYCAHTLEDCIWETRRHGQM